MEKRVLERGKLTYVLSLGISDYLLAKPYDKLEISKKM